MFWPFVAATSSCHVRPVNHEGTSLKLSPYSVTEKQEKSVVTEWKVQQNVAWTACVHDWLFGNPQKSAGWLTADLGIVLPGHWSSCLLPLWAAEVLLCIKPTKGSRLLVLHLNCRKHCKLLYRTIIHQKQKQRNKKKQLTAQFQAQSWVWSSLHAAAAEFGVSPECRTALVLLTGLQTPYAEAPAPAGWATPPSSTAGWH